MTQVLSISYALQVADDLTVTKLDVQIAGLPEDESTPEEGLMDKLAAAVAVAVKQHNEDVFRNTNQQKG